jgi:DNA-binding response OmpR family regulator
MHDRLQVTPRPPFDYHLTDRLRRPLRSRQSFGGGLVFQPAGPGRGEADATTALKRRLAAIRRVLRGAETALERALDYLEAAEEELEGSAGALRQAARRSQRRSPIPLPVATSLRVLDPGRVAFVVHDVEHRVALSPARVDLLRLLCQTPPVSADGLVGFMSVSRIVHQLRAQGWEATGRSVTVEISRVRGALGPGNGRLIETRRGGGYRFRLLVLAGRGAAE